MGILYLCSGPLPDGVQWRFLMNHPVSPSLFPIHRSLKYFQINHKECALIARRGFHFCLVACILTLEIHSLVATLLSDFIVGLLHLVTILGAPGQVSRNFYSLTDWVYDLVQ